MEAKQRWECRSKHNAAIGAGKLSGDGLQGWEVTHHIPWGTSYRIIKASWIHESWNPSLTWSWPYALQVYTEGFCLSWAEAVQGTPNNKVTLLCLSLHHWPEQLPAQGAGHLPLCKQPCILQLTSAGCCSVDMSSYDGKMAQTQMMQTVLLRELSKPLSFETSLIWMFHCKCFKQGFSSKVTASTTYSQN